MSVTATRWDRTVVLTLPGDVRVALPLEHVPAVAAALNANAAAWIRQAAAEDAAKWAAALRNADPQPQSPIPPG